MVEKNKITVLILSNIILILAAAVCLIPFLVVLSASFSNEGQIVAKGYGILPKGFTLDAYKITFAHGEQVLNAYIMTIVTTAAGSVLSLFITALAAFPLSRCDYKWKRFFNLFIYFTMIFSGGAIASYLWITQGLRLRDNPLVLILPMLIGGSNVFLMRTYMSKVPYDLIEASKIDGAGEYLIFFKVIIPMTKVGLATIFVMTALNYWNQWYACLMYFSDDRYMTLQYYLIRVMQNIDSILKSQNSMAASVDISNMPSETTRMAMCVISAGPMIFVFSFFQKYFAGGIAIGSVKG